MNEAKYQVNSVYEIRLGNTKKGLARLISLKRIRIDHINDHIALLDTGYRAEECKQLIKTMYKNRHVNWESQDLAYCLFMYVEDKKDLFNN